MDRNSEPRKRHDAIAGIYSITDIDGRVYVGSSVDIRARWLQHRRSLGKGEHHNFRLQRYWDTNGAGALSWKILQVVPATDELGAFEQYWIDVVGPWYNVSLVADRPVVSEPVLAARAEKRLDLELARDIEGGVRSQPSTPEPRNQLVQGRVSREVLEVIKAQPQSVGTMMETVGQALISTGMTYREFCDALDSALTNA